MFSIFTISHFLNAQTSNLWVTINPNSGSSNQINEDIVINNGFTIENNSSNNSSSASFGMVTFRSAFNSIARLIANTAPLFLAQLLRETPLFTSQNNMDLILFWDDSLPSITIPNPPLITSPHPTLDRDFIGTLNAPSKQSETFACPNEESSAC